VHRNHFQPTAAQCRLARHVTGFPVYGAIVCNNAVGGLNPAAVEVALAAGAMWVGLPTLSTAHHRKAVIHVPEAARSGVDLGRAALSLINPDGRIRDEVRDIVALADLHDIVVGLGYPGAAECVAVLKAGRRSAAPFVLTNPIATMGLGLVEVQELIRSGQVVIEVTCYALYRACLRGEADAVLLSSDSGIRTAPPGPALMSWAITSLLERGFDETWVPA
jgi:Family of unknown function (DUF6282)